MADFKGTMMEKFKKMRAKQKEWLKDVKDVISGKETKVDGGSKRERSKKVETSKKEKKKKDREEDSVRKGRRNEESVSLKSKKERKRRGADDKKDKKRVNRKRKDDKADETPANQRKSKISDVPTTDAQKENFANFMTEMFGMGMDGIINQYKTYLKSYIPPNYAHNAFSKHPKKNRYKDVICIDSTRVILKNAADDYIHANYVTGEPFINTFICTQGPMSTTVNDFWLMVMQEKVGQIIMLCNVVEDLRLKCFQYWPVEAGASLTFNEVIVRTVEVDETKDTTYTLTILEAEFKNSRQVIKHMRWRDWPDKGVPSSVLAPFRLLKVARQATQSTIVHCSAGIGRTGCIIAIEMALQHLLQGNPFALAPMVQKLRGMRMSCVQTDEQLAYVVRCLVAYSDVCGIFSFRPELHDKCDKFISEYEGYFSNKLAELRKKFVLQLTEEHTQEECCE